MHQRYDETKKSDREAPSGLPGSVVNTIKRIENNPCVLGVIFFRNGFVEMCTVPLNMIQPLSIELPPLTELIQRALGEIVKFDGCNW